MLVLIVPFVALAVMPPEAALAERPGRPLPGGSPKRREQAGGDHLRRVRDLPVRAHHLRGTARHAEHHRELRADLHLRDLLACAGAAERAVRRNRVFNPWRAIGRAVAWVARTAARTEPPAPLDTAWLGCWPAAAGIFAFATIELVALNGDKPDSLAVAVLADSVTTFIGMALDGVERWTDRARGLLGLLQPVLTHVADRDARGRGGPAQAALRPAAASATARDGRTRVGDDRRGPVRRLQQQAARKSVSPDIAQFFQDHGLSPQHALEATLMLVRPAGCSSWRASTGSACSGRGAWAVASARAGWPTSSRIRSCRPPSPTSLRTTSRCCSSRARASRT